MSTENQTQPLPRRRCEKCWGKIYGDETCDCDYEPDYAPLLNPGAVTLRRRSLRDRLVMCCSHDEIRAIEALAEACKAMMEYMPCHQGEQPCDSGLGVYALAESAIARLEV